MKRLLISLAVLALAACGGNDSCKVDDPDACGGGQVCETVEGKTEPACFQPLVVQGRVFDATTDAGIPNARVTAEEVSGRSVGQVAISGPDGTYTLQVPAIRKDETGTPVGQTLKLSAAARDYTPFPSGLRQALPLDTSGAKATDADHPYVVESGPSAIGLDPVAPELKGLPTLSGRVDVSTPDGGVSDAEILVAAEQQGGTGTPTTVTGRADTTGAYTLFNVPAGDYQVQAYRKGANYTPKAAKVATSDVTQIDLALSQTPTATLDGSVNLVAAPGGSVTSVVVALESTFIDSLARGTLVPGLRAPEPGTAPNVSGDFQIAGIPDGRYVVLAAFENDGLVRDPDPNQAGTQIQHLEVKDGAIVVPPEAFKVTGAISMVGPGAGDTVEEVTGTPTFVWHPYSSAHTYEVQLFDTLGNEIWNTTIDAGSGADESVPYAGSETLTPGSVYQWRATAFGQNGNPISQTEDLQGVFRVQAP